jgi:uncharacterized protein YbjT (DUF2867 family)
LHGPSKHLKLQSTLWVSTVQKVVKSPVLVVGASGFVGRHLCVALQAADYIVRRGTSNKARCKAEPSDGWTFIDMNEPGTYGKTLDGCRSVVYLFHALGTGLDYAAREARAARQFRDAATRCGVETLVYLGGVAPPAPTSQHLESRRATGRILSEGQLTVIELRAAMIIGRGSTSFNLVRDLAVRTPLVALPDWLDHGSCPIAIDDVVYALIRALELDVTQGAYFDLPGPEWLSHRELLERISSLVGTRIIKRRLPLISTKFAARLLSLITREHPAIITELVEGLPSDLTPSGESFWSAIGEVPSRTVMSAILSALADETSKVEPSVATRERLTARVLGRA